MILGRVKTLQGKADNPNVRRLTQILADLRQSATDLRTIFHFDITLKPGSPLFSRLSKSSTALQNP